MAGIKKSSNPFNQGSDSHSSLNSEGLLLTKSIYSEGLKSDKEIST